MAVSLKDPQDGDIGEISDINVTPFIDVILVLLIIFMVAAPLSTVDVPVELPVSNAQPQPRPDKPVFLTIKRDLSLAIGDDPAPREKLQTDLDQHTGHDREQRIFLRADSTIAYSELMTVKTFSEVIELSTAHARKQFESATAQGKELCALAQKVATDAAEPVKESVAKAFKKVA